MTGDEDSGVEAIGGDVVPFFLDTGIVPSLLGFEAKKYSLPSKGRVYASIISFTTSPLHNNRYGIGEKGAERTSS